MPILKRLFGRGASAQAVRPPYPRTQLQLEPLESRVVPYSVSGDAWVHPELVTISFEPDGTHLGGATSNLFATFNARFGSTAAWQNQILKAAQVWAQATNLNFSLVADDGSPTGSGNYQQGNAEFGDIRIGGFNFGSNALGMAYMPPGDNNYSVAGDIALNTAQPFNIGSTYDLFTVASHEIGHALGLYHSDTWGAVMGANYSTRLTGLNSDDMAGIRNIYSSNNPRSHDVYSAGGGTTSFTTASDITAQINTTSETALVTNLDITTASHPEYFKFTAPAGSGNTLTVTVQSSGLSLLAPTLTVYNGSQTQLATVSGAGHYGTTLTLTVNGLTPGSTYYVKAAGADGTALGTGKYGMTLNLGTGTSPTVPLPATQTANGNPISGSGGQAFNPTTIQTVLNDVVKSVVGLLQGGVGGLLHGVEGILRDAAGVFDLLEAPTNNALFHPHGCNCPVCSRSVAPDQTSTAAVEKDATNLGLERELLVGTGKDALGTPASANATPVPLAEDGPTAGAARLADGANVDSFADSHQEQSASWWSDACAAYFADLN